MRMLNGIPKQCTIYERESVVGTRLLLVALYCFQFCREIVNLIFYVFVVIQLASLFI